MHYEILEKSNLFDFRSIKESLGVLGNSLIRDGYDEKASKILVDLCALSAAELSILNETFKEDSKLLLPMRIENKIFSFAVLKTDTLPHWRCRTAGRIKNVDIRTYDLFMFASDVDKYDELNIPLERLKEEFPSIMDNFITDLNKTTTGALSGANDLLEKGFLHLEAIIWRLRLDILYQIDEEKSENIISELLVYWDRIIRVPAKVTY